jgi:hypothetical protein
VNAGIEGRITQVGYELRRIAEQGACVIASVQAAHAAWLSPAATVALDLSNEPYPPQELTERLRKLGARQLQLRLSKNRVGSTGDVKLSFIPGAATLEELRT